MFVSDFGKIIFIHNHKAAGTSIRKALIDKYPDLKVWGSVHSYARCANYSFYPRYFKFGYVRNPWDRLLSYYHMMIEHPGANQGDVIWDYFRRVNPTTFEEFITECIDTLHDGVCSTTSFVANQIDYFTNEDGMLLVNYIGKVEDVNDNPLGLDIPVLNTTKKRKHYRHFYSNYTRDLIGERFKRDCEYFGYEF